MNKGILSCAIVAALASPATLLAEPRTVTVYVFNLDYSQTHPDPPYPADPPPDDPEIRVGDTIRWVRVSGTHDVHSAAGTLEQFASPIITAAAPYSHTYTHEGRFYYYCTFHGFNIPGGFAGGMSGYIDVLPALPPPCDADLGKGGGVAGQDGILDNNDFIAFINLFFENSPSTDLGKAGGVAGSDGLFNNNDFIAFINLFFNGCP